MAKVLIFADGSSQICTENSRPNSISVVVTQYGEVDKIRAKMTETNLEGAKFDGQTLTGYVPVSSNASAKADGNITATFINKGKSDAEVEELRQRVSQLEAENETLTTENEALVAENETLTDKATAADILLGNEEVEG